MRNVSIILAIFWAVVIGYFVWSCGTVPFDPCSPAEAQTKRCSSDETEVQYCAGGYWNPILQCDEITGPDGEPVNSVCVKSRCEEVAK